MRHTFSKKDLKTHLATLDGYLRGITALTGEYGDYGGSAYLVTMSGGAESLARDINSHYYRQFHFDFHSVEKLAGGMGELERLIRPYITKNLLGAGDEAFDPQAVNVRQLNTSFWIMDMVDWVIDAGRLKTRTKPDVYKLAAFDPNYGQSDFFCILLRRRMLVLQFNDRSDAALKRPVGCAEARSASVA